MSRPAIRSQMVFSRLKPALRQPFCGSTDFLLTDYAGLDLGRFPRCGVGRSVPIPAGFVCVPSVIISVNAV